jgi:hypothetical protein
MRGLLEPVEALSARPPDGGEATTIPVVWSTLAKVIAIVANVEAFRANTR